MTRMNEKQAYELQAELDRIVRDYVDSKRLGQDYFVTLFQSVETETSYGGSTTSWYEGETAPNQGVLDDNLRRMREEYVRISEKIKEKEKTALKEYTDEDFARIASAYGRNEGADVYEVFCKDALVVTRAVRMLQDERLDFTLHPGAFLSDSDLVEMEGKFKGPSTIRVLPKARCWHFATPADEKILPDSFVTIDELEKIIELLPKR